MLCPKCSSDSAAPRAKTCGNCGYRFALDPDAPHQLSDADFLRLADLASSGGRYFFTQNQIYLYYCNERMPRNMIWPFAGLVGGGLGSYLADTYGAFVGAVLAAGFIYYGTQSWKPPPRSVLDGLSDDMKTAGHSIKKMITKSKFEIGPEEDYTGHLPSYTEIDHLVIVDRNPLVDLLVLNDFPKRAKALVVSQSGYPNFVIPVARELLQKRKRVSVYLLHDSTESRFTMKRKLANSEMLPTGGHRMFNLGLDPEQVKYMKQLNPIQPARSKFGIPLDSIPYPILDSALTYSIMRGVPLLTAFATKGFVGQE